MGRLLGILRRMLLRVLLPVSRRFAERRKRQEVDLDFYWNMIGLIRSGDIVLTKTHGRLTNWMIPGGYKHAAMIVSCDDVLHVCEAAYPHVKESDLLSFMLRSDEVCVIRPRGVSKHEQAAAAEQMRKLVGKPYDLLFEPGEDAFYCSEAIAFCYHVASPQLSFERRSILGVDTVIPDDFRRSSKMKVIIES